jgi:X-X-X-Leu-X-X-Gly heptad repeat protein
MHRREFLQIAALNTFGILAPGVKGWAFSNGQDDPSKKKLVVIFLRGGVDGLNVVIPFGDSNYYSIRPSIAVARPGGGTSAINLDSYWGMHPALNPLSPFWKNKQLAFVHASGSPDPTRSHFDAQDYMESGAPGDKLIGSGWMNRLLTTLPSKHSPVQAISFGPVLPRIFSGQAAVATVDRGDKSKPIPIDHPVISACFQELYAGRKDYLGNAFAEGMSAHKTINNALDNPQLDMEQVQANKGAPVARNYRGFGSQLANLFRRDATIQVAFTDIGGWDTHVNQGAGSGQLANNLSSLSNGLADLANGLGPLFKDTTIIVMSEFGRTARENGNGGTDHGHGNVMWVLGGQVPGGKVYARWSSLAVKDLNEGRDVPTTTDFRNVLTWTLNEQMNISKASLQKIFPGFDSKGSILVS